jgi:hypothetical protein
MIREKVKDPERVGYTSDYIVERLFCDARPDATLQDF